MLYVYSVLKRIDYINDKRWQRKYISTDRYISANIKSEGSIKESVIVTKV